VSFWRRAASIARAENRSERSRTESTLAAAGNPSERCEAQFYGGEWKLLQGDRAAAATALTAAADTCPKSFIEHKGAEAELQRLRQ